MSHLNARVIKLPFGQTLSKRLPALLFPLLAVGFLALLVSWLPHGYPVQASETDHHLATQDPPYLELVGHLGGETGKVVFEASGSAEPRYAYLAQGIELTILDISDPANPHRLGYLLLPGFIRGLDLDGNYIYAGWERCEWWNSYACSGGLKVVDVSNPAHPFEIGSCEVPGATPDLDVVDGKAYILWQTWLSAGHPLAGLKILDVSSPDEPIELKSMDFDYEEMESIAIANGYGYLAGNFLYTYDLTDPNVPALTDTSVYSGDDIVVSGGYAYVVGLSGLLVLSLADPAHPVFTGGVGVDGMTEAVAVQGHYAYLSETGYFRNGTFFYGGLRVMDVISPTAPLEVGYLPLPYGSKGVVVNDELAYVAEVYNGLSVVDISMPTDPAMISSYAAPGIVDDVVTTGGDAYLAAGYALPGSGGLWSMDISNRMNPLSIGYHEVLDARKVVVSGNYAYALVSYYQSGMGYFNNYLHIVDITDPAQPAGVTVYPLPQEEGAPDLDVADGYAYVAQTERLVVVDVRNPAAPVTTDTITATHAVYDVAVSGAYVYVCDGSLRVFDRSDPAHLVEIASLPIAGYVRTLAISGQYAYLAGGIGLYIVDISDPAHPVEKGSTTIASGNIYDIAAAGNFAFLAADDAGLRVIDASSPMLPFETVSYTPPQIVVGVYTSGGYVYAAGWRTGLYIFRFNPLIQTYFLPFVAR